MAYALYQPDLDLICAQLALSGRLDDISALPAYSAFAPDAAEAILNEAARFASEVLSPINHSADKQRAQLLGNLVKLPDGFKQAYRAFCDSGWISAPAAPENGGMGLPRVLSTLTGEMWHGSNMSFGLCPMLTQSAIELIDRFAAKSLKDAYLPKLISGHWAGTMCMTEPQAGSDVGAVKTRAVKEADIYKITGTKIFITYGEQDVTENIIHMVLARLPGAPDGSRGLSLFLVPKFMVNKDGSLGAQNDVKCISLEHKLGIHASPTCVMAFGENGGATGWLVGEQNKGIQAMFAMMNAARFAVGLQGLGIAEYARQMAHAYARERIQGKPLGSQGGTISQHPDMERILNMLDAQTAGLRALALHTASHMDISEQHADEMTRKAAAARVALMIPLVKAHSTDVAFKATSDAMQVFGGMGYIEETGIAQLMRDVRVAMIYEGTNGIQALDLSSRKLPMDNGSLIRSLLTEIWEFMSVFEKTNDNALKPAAKSLSEHFAALDNATIWMQQTLGDATSDITAGRAVQAASAPYLELLSTWTIAYLLAKSAYDADGAAITPHARQQLKAHAMFYALNILPNVAGLSRSIIHTRFWAK